jgi:hypothetical protein
MLPATVKKTRSWPVRATGILLFFEAAGLVGFSIYLLTRLDWTFLEFEELIDQSITPSHVEAISVVFTFFPIAIMAVFAAIGFTLLLRVGWLLATIVQAAILVACLQWYFTTRPAFIYPIMLVSIVMVLYLNSFDVRTAFQARSSKTASGSRP